MNNLITGSKQADAEQEQSNRLAKLSPKQRAFVNEYPVDYSATYAAQRAGYSKEYSGKSGYVNLKNPIIALCIRFELDKQEERNNLSADKVLKGIMSIAFHDIGELFDATGKAKNINDIPEHIRLIIQEYKVSYDRDGNRSVSVKIPDKLKALEMLGRHLTIFKEVVEHRADDKLLQLMRQARKRVESHGYIIRNKEKAENAEYSEVEENSPEIPANTADNT